VLAFTGVFFYQYLKPKYGGLVVKTTPSGAAVYVDGKQRGSSPLTIGEIRAGGHQIKAAKEGYREYVQQVEVIPYSTENLHWTLDPIVPHLTNEQLAEIEAWKKKVESDENRCQHQRSGEADRRVDRKGGSSLQRGHPRSARQGQCPGCAAQYRAPRQEECLRPGGAVAAQGAVGKQGRHEDQQRRLAGRS